MNLASALASNRYPGRGVLVARTRAGLCCGYFLTGRSDASKERTLHERGGRLVVAPASATEHDPLRHYVAARSDDGRLVYGNGEQVTVIADRLADGLSPAEALNRISYEPDPPIYTPRISVVVTAGGIWFGAARRSVRGRTAANVLVLAVDGLADGDAVVMTTYRSDGVTVATGDPFVEASADVAGPDDLLDLIWDALDPAYRVAAATFRPHELAAASIRS